MGEKLGQSQTVQCQKSNFYKVLREERSKNPYYFACQNTVSELEQQVQISNIQGTHGIWHIWNLHEENIDNKP